MSTATTTTSAGPVAEHPPTQREAAMPHLHNEPTDPPAGGGPSGSALPQRVDLLGVGIDPLTESGTIDAVLASLDRSWGGMLVTANLDHLRRCVKDPSYGELVRDADLVVADGMPLVWASKLQGTPLPERVAGATLTLTLTERAAGAGRSVFLLGGNPGAAEGAAREFERRFPGICIAGTHCPPVGFEKDEVQAAAVRDALVDAKPDLVYVALGSPKQERLIRDLRALLPGAWWVGVGISFSFVTGEVRRAPAWIQKLGFEWLHRLTQEPGRLFRRYIIDGVPFALELLVRSLLRRGRV